MNFTKILTSIIKNIVIIAIIILNSSIASFSEEKKRTISAENWTVVCSKNNKTNFCISAIRNELVIDNNGASRSQTMGTAYIEIGIGTQKKMNLVDANSQTYKVKEQKTKIPVLFIELPLGLDLKVKPIVAADGKNILKLDFSHCTDKAGCVARAVLNQNIIEMLKNGKSISVFIKPYGMQKTMELNFPLKGFTKTYKKLIS